MVSSFCSMIDTVVHAVHVHLTSKAGDDESENVKVRARARYRCRDTTHIQTDRHTPHTPQVARVVKLGPQAENPPGEGQPLCKGQMLHTRIFLSVSIYKEEKNVQCNK